MTTTNTQPKTKSKGFVTTALTALMLCTACMHANARTANGQGYADYPIQGVPFSNVTLTDHFWQPRLAQNQTTTIPIALEQCWSTGRVANFLKAAAILKGDYSLGYFSTDYTFDDTDIYKILEGMSYSYKMMPSTNIKEQMDTLVKIVAAAQEPDGYLVTARTAGKPGNLHPWLGAGRWALDPDLSHELYCSGHLFEAATAHYQATGDTTLLNVAKRNADLLVRKFLKGGLAYEPGHQIVEMGLVKMYRVTGNEDYLKLAKYFLDIRGVNGPNSKHYDYNQSHMPPAQQTEAVGHAVRATYMYSGMADVAAIMGAKEYQHAIDQIWNNVVDKKYYITGGIGALHSGEAFGSNYELPNATAYNETCAAIANVYWNWRMFLAYGDSKYYDVIERTLYNGVLSGISLSGDHFFYPNPLESNGGYSRSAWFGCACCPSNLCRFIPSVPGYVYAHRDDSVFVNLFIGSHAKIGLGGGRLMRLTQTTNYPWNGAVSLTIEQAPPTHVALKIRIPGWARNHPVPSNLYTYLDNKDNRDSVRLNVNGTPTPYRIEKGYMVVDRQWKAGDKLDFDMNMKVRRVVANDKVGADRGKVALERGPIVYCLEHADNNGEVLSSVVTDTATITAREDSTIFRLLPNHDMVVLDINGGEGTFNSDGSLTTKAKRLTAIPYYAWANREAGQMEVWMARTPDNTDVAARHISHTDTLKVNVGQVPASTASGAYPSVPVKADIAAVAKAFGISVSDVKNLYGSSITYAAIEPNGNVNTNSTAIAPGHWFAADGSVTNWDGTGTKSLVFSEFQPASFVFNIGQFPNSNHNGDSYIIRQALTYSPGNDVPRRVVFEFKVDFTNAQGVYNRELKVAKGFLNSQDYANVRGDEMTELRQAVTADASYNYTEATQNLYDAVAAFVDAKAAFDEYSDAADRAFKAPTQYPYATKEKLDDLTDQIAASPESAYEASALTGTITKAYKAVVLSNADAESTGNSNNLVSNPDFANNNGHTADNWNIVTFTAGFKNITTDENYDTTNKPYFVNYGSWGQGTSAFDFKMSQTIQKVPAGRYLISLMSRGKDLDLYTLNITAIGLDTTVTLPFYGNTGQLFGNGWNSAYYVVDVHTDGDVTITATATASKDQTFISLGRFRMLKLPYTTTGIQPTKKDQNGMQKTYNLNGQLMGNDQDDMNGLPRGIYIKSGRKVLTTPHTRAR